MREIRWQLFLGILLVAVSALLYIFHYILFHDPHHIFIYLVGDIAFLPIEVLLVTLVVHQLLERRERRRRMEKLNMVIGTFFSALGTDLLARFSAADPGIDRLRRDLIVTQEWGNEEFLKVETCLMAYECTIETGRVDLPALKHFLTGHGDFLLRLLENPALLEHETFTDLLRAVFHLTEELIHREDFSLLPASDRAHLQIDVVRVYTLLVREWLEYMRYLKQSYPYLFSLAMRTNPFDEKASPIVT